MSDSTHKHHIGKSGLILFDGTCGTCSTVIGEKRRFFEKYGFSVAALQEPWVRDLTGIHEDTLLQAIHLYTAEGNIFQGVDFIAYLAERVWWLRPIGLVLKISFLRPFWQKMYDEVAKRRKCISQACGLQSRALYTKRR